MEMSDGQKHVSQVDYPKGSIQNPMTDAELRAKFDSLAVPVIGEKRSAQLADLVHGIERCDNVRRLMQLTAPASRR